MYSYRTNSQTNKQTKKNKIFDFFFFCLKAALLIYYFSLFLEIFVINYSLCPVNCHCHCAFVHSLNPQASSCPDPRHLFLSSVICVELSKVKRQDRLTRRQVDIYLCLESLLDRRLRRSHQNEAKWTLQLELF